MLYAVLSFWLLVIVFAAWAVHWLWSRLVKPRVVNTLLLPGTLIAQLGHVLGLLVTGNSVRNTALMGDDEKGEPTADAPDTQRIPVIGSVVTGLLPLVACAAGLYVAARLWGSDVLTSGSAVRVPQEVPLTLPGIWELLRVSITVSEALLNGILNSDLTKWQTLLFIYLAICLTVRMTPFEDNRRGAIGAILLSGILIGVASLVSGRVEDAVLSSWSVLSFAVGMLLFLLLLSLAVTGLVGLIRILAQNK